MSAGATIAMAGISEANAAINTAVEMQEMQFMAELNMMLNFEMAVINLAEEGAKDVKDAAQGH